MNSLWKNWFLISLLFRCGYIHIYVYVYSNASLFPSASSSLTLSLASSLPVFSFLWPTNSNANCFAAHFPFLRSLLSGCCLLLLLLHVASCIRFAFLMSEAFFFSIFFAIVYCLALCLLRPSHTGSHTDKTWWIGRLQKTNYIWAKRI